ncbi:MAG: hypothetical protein V1838_05770, partial [Patescibacteria group bacterium]
HFAYWPGVFVPSYPLYFIGNKIFHYFDIRWLLIIFFVITVGVLYHLPEQHGRRRLLVILFAFNPLFVAPLTMGHNEIIIYFWLALSLYFLKTSRWRWAVFSLALACLTKQTAWFLVPFFILYLGGRLMMTEKRIARVIRSMFKIAWPSILIGVVLLLPFLLWDLTAFIDDTILYPAGGGSSGYSIAGVGFSMMLREGGGISSIFDQYPFWIWQLAVGLPLLVGLCYWQKRHNTLAQLMFNYALWLFAIWFFSRYFHVSHLGYVLGAVFIAYLIQERTLKSAKI